MAALTRANVLAYLKERWIDEDQMMLAIMANAPLLGMLEKNGKALPVGGKYMKLPQLRVGVQGRSATYATAVTNQKASQAVGFEVQYVSNYQPILLEGDIVDDAQGDQNSIAEMIDHETEGAMASMRKDLQLSIFGNAGGARGRVGSLATGIAGANCRIVLSNPTDSKFFEEGMVLAASDNDGTAAAHALRDSGDTILMTGIDKINGFLEFGSAVTSIAAIAANDYLFAAGDFKGKWSGLGGWLPTTAPTSGDSFHGVDRSAGTQVLSGLRYSMTGVPIEEGLIAGAGYADLYDAHFDFGVLNPVRWARMVNSLQADRANRLTKVEGTAGKAVIGYSAIMVATNFGEVPFTADGGCGINEAFGLTLGSWRIGYVGDELVHVVQDDGNRMRRPAAGGDAWQLDVKCRGNVGCSAPGKNMRFALSSLS